MLAIYDIGVFLHTGVYALISSTENKVIKKSLEKGRRTICLFPVITFSSYWLDFCLFLSALLQIPVHTGTIRFLSQQPDNINFCFYVKKIM